MLAGKSRSKKHSPPRTPRVPGRFLSVLGVLCGKRKLDSFATTFGPQAILRSLRVSGLLLSPLPFLLFAPLLFLVLLDHLPQSRQFIAELVGGNSGFRRVADDGGSNQEDQFGPLRGDGSIAEQSPQVRDVPQQGD